MLVARVAKSSVGYTGGTWDIFTNCHLFVLHGNICDISSFSMLDQIPGELHNMLRDVIFEAAASADLGPVKEEKHLLPGSSARPGDVVIRRWSNGKDGAIDVTVTIRADKNLKAELGIIFDCLGGTEKKVRKSRHFAKKLHQCLYFYKKARKSRHFAKKTHKCCQKVPGQIKVLGN